jgi:hypothetical protein
MMWDKATSTAPDFYLASAAVPIVPIVGTSNRARISRNGVTDAPQYAAARSLAPCNFDSWSILEFVTAINLETTL